MMAIYPISVTVEWITGHAHIWENNLRDISKTRESFSYLKTKASVVPSSYKQPDSQKQQEGLPKES